ncbi:hypothetical protein CPB86DRAFT_784484 [Serendipita vermifera]|nr:hypothetical protein CPB86DRAFT_784484 [Serendipita vermifera]
MAVLESNNHEDNLYCCDIPVYGIGSRCRRNNLLYSRHRGGCDKIGPNGHKYCDPLRFWMPYYHPYNYQNGDSHPDQDQNYQTPLPHLHVRSKAG